MPAQPLQTLSLFSGIGGIEVGLAEAGAAEISGFVDSWASARSVLTDRFPGVPVGTDVSELENLGGADLVTAGFPCTDLSQAGRTRGLAGDASSLVLKVLELVDRDRPAWLMLENVPNLLHLGGGSAISPIVDSLEDSGYSWAYRVVDSRFTGLAQRRRRVILLASNVRDPAPMLLAEDSGPPVGDQGVTAYGFSWTEGNRGVGWAPGAVPTIKGGTTQRVASPPAVWLPGAELRHQIVRPSIESVEVLQGFSPGWTSVAPVRDRWKLVGNAVSTRVARWVADRLALRDRPIDSVWPEELLVDGARWPSAARGADGKRWKVIASEYPQTPSSGEHQDLLTVLKTHGAQPLSLRATKGFRDRLIRSRLTFSDEFLASLNDHIVAYSDDRSSG
ncbi:DNA (cytosine-5-)-methyltransferase [Nakamurella deserti]|uniref:DNA cytosine methyltransferase n=1 Tax=Nakamurella deserti TaxID=2164074 RepID=UPI000DBE5846